MFPYLDLTGVQLRSLLRPTYFTDVETLTPGFTVQSLATQSSVINAQMRKRYGGQLPWGSQPPALVPSGLTPPSVTLQGIPTLGSMIVIIQITTGGPLGTAIFQWSSNNGSSFTTGVLTAASVQLGSIGLYALFPAVGTYDTSNFYAAAPPVPEVILQWLTSLTTEDVAIRHGVSSNDPLWEQISKRAELARTQIEQAANTKDGLWDLPVSEDLGSAVDTGGPLSYSESSPYTWTFKQARAATHASCEPDDDDPNGLVGG